MNSKSAIKIGTWNIRTMCPTGKTNTIAKEMRAYNLRVLGLAETRWLQAGQTRLATGEVIIHSGHSDEQAHHTEGVALMLSKDGQRALLGWEPVDSRIITAQFRTSQKRVALNIIQCYAPTNNADDSKKEEFYQKLDDTIRKMSKRDITILMGDMNAKVGPDNSGYEQVMGKHGLGTMNSNGELFANCCAEHNMVIGGTTFPHKKSHKATWVSPDMTTENQIDHICVSKKFRRTLQDVRARRGADAATDHHLVEAKLQLKLKKSTNKKPQGERFNVSMFRDTRKQATYQLELSNKYQALQDLEDSESLESKWQGMKEAWVAACRTTVGTKKGKQQDWTTPETLIKVEARKRQKEVLNNSRTRASKQKAMQEYSRANREVRNSARRDKRAYVNRLAEEAEEAAGKNNMKALYDTTRQLAGKHHRATRPVKSKEGEVLNTIDEQLKRWMEHFKNLLNQPPPINIANIPPPNQVLKINCNRPSKAEIKKAIQHMKNNKAPGPDNIPAKALKADTATSSDMLYDLLGEVWKVEDVPAEWKEGHLIKLPKKGDLSKCENYRGIMLLSAPGKVLNRIILERIKTAVDKYLREEQAGFRAGRSCTDQIATLRVILEQSQEYKSPLYVTFIDFEKAFDSLDREVLWKLMQYYGIPAKLTNIIRNTYKGMECRVLHEGQLTEPFKVTTGVRQGCLLSPFLFLLAVDWIMTNATKGKRNGIQWTPFVQLDDLDFADDIALLSHSHSQTQDKATNIEHRAAETGLRISTKKTKVLKANTSNKDPVLIQGQALEEVSSFTYLGSTVDSSGGTDLDVQARIGKARTAFVMLETIWKQGNISLTTKLRLFNSNVKTVLLYGGETWKTSKHVLNKLQVFVNKCLRRILNVRWPDKIRNEELWKRTNQVPIEEEIKKRKWKWIGHTLRKPPSNIAKQALKWNPQGKRKIGRPRNTWRRYTEAEMEKMGYTWKQLEKLAQSRPRWRSVVSGLSSPAEQRPK